MRTCQGEILLAGVIHGHDGLQLLQNQVALIFLEGLYLGDDDAGFHRGDSCPYRITAALAQGINTLGNSFGTQYPCCRVGKGKV